MTLRQANGNSVNGVHATAMATWAVSNGGVTSSNSFVIPNVNNIEIRNDGELKSKTSKRHSLVDQKRRQWAEEKGEQEEWYPFGRPGGGAPLKSPLDRLSQQRLRSYNHNVTSGSCCSEGAKSDGSGMDFSGPPGYYQINAENHCANGGAQHQSIPPHVNNQFSLPAGYVYQNGYFTSYPGTVATRPAPIASDSSCQMYPPSGAVAGALTNNLIPGIAQTNHCASMLPGAVNISVPESNGSHPGFGSHFAYYHPQHYGYVQGLGTVPLQDHSQGYTVASFAPAVVYPTDSSVSNAGRNSLTGSASSPSNGQQINLIPHSQYTFPRPSNNPSTTSYTEQWADRLPLWQGGDPPSPEHQRPNALELPHPVIPNGKPSQFIAGNTSTPVSSGSHPVTMAWVSPIQVKPASYQQSPEQSQPTVSQQRMAFISPLHSKAPSLSGNETLDGSINIQFMSASHSGSAPTGNDSGIHRRRTKVNAQKSEYDVEEKQMRMMEQKMALEEQLAEKRRKQLIDEERERRELERAERERRLIEAKEAHENEEERSRWKKLAEKDEKREELIMETLQRAQEEAKRIRRATLRRHASSGRQSESDPNESLSPPELPQPVLNGHNHIAISNENQDSGSDTSPLSTDPPMSSGPRSHSLPPSTVGRQVESPGDERPIRPLTKDPLQVWEELGYVNVGENESKTELKRNTPVRQSLRKSRSNEATKLDAARRAGSLERKNSKLNGIETQGNKQPPTINNGSPKLNGGGNEDIALADNSSVNGRLKSAGLISNATFIIDSKENGFHETKNGQVNKELDKRDDGSATKKKDANGIMQSTEKKNIERSNAKEHSKKLAGDEKTKLLQKRPTADKPMLTSITSDNPWGDTFGGLNPLLQPLVTRRRKLRQDLPIPGAVIEPYPQAPMASAVSTTPKILSVGPRTRSDSLSELPPQTGENDSNNKEIKTDEKLDGKNPCSVKGLQQVLNAAKPSSVRTPSLDRFNAKNPLYGSISAKMKRPTEAQGRLMEQLSLLREQLKKKQKEVEGGLSSASKVKSASDQK